MLDKAYIVHNIEDNVGIAIKDLNADQLVSCASAQFHEKTIRLKNDIPFGHKFALSPIVLDGKIIRYGECIGLATANIAAGEHVHVHNVKSARCHEE
ncbi:MAG TPA: UxaA family hydrolase [Bacillota bacterium]|nr:UxaA family hydrolase [Bacillota bacterium]HPM63471.1 UxaA family hydrolase [Bacillota bacterium]